MKKYFSTFNPFKIILPLLMVVGLFLLWFNHSKWSTASFKGEEGEEAESGQEILGAFDMWSDMRGYPAANFSSASIGDAFNYSRTSLEPQSRSNNLLNTAAAAPWTALGPWNFAGRALCLGFDPVTPTTMYVGTAAGGLWKTTTGGTGAAGGVNWTYVPTGFPVLAVSSIAINPANGNEIYIGTGEVYDNSAPYSGVSGAGNVRTYRGSYGIGILKTIDGGATWSKALNFPNTSLIGVSDLVIDPGNTQIVYAATTSGLYRSVNGGTAWVQISNVALAMDLCYKPGSSTVLYASFGDFGTAGAGIYKSTDANSANPTFTKMAGGLPTTISGKIMLATTAAAPLNVYASIGNSPYVSTDPKGLYRSVDDGVNWTGVKTAGNSIITNQGWYAHDIAVDPTSATIIYWGELDLYKSTNSGGAFNKMSVWSGWSTSNTTVGTTSEGSANYVHADIHRIYISPVNSSLVYMCTDGGVFVSNNAATSSFSSLNGGLQTTQMYNNVGISTTSTFMIAGMQDNEGVIYAGIPGCKRIGSLGDGFHAAVDPTNENNCFVESYYMNNLLKSSDKAVSWPTSLFSNPNTPPPPENACFNSPFVIAPSSPQTIYAGTIYLRKTTSAGSLAGAGPIMNGGAPLSNANAPILTIAVSKTVANTLYASTVPYTAGGIRSKIWKSVDGAASFADITGLLPDRYYTKIAVDPTNPSRIAVTLSGFGSSHLFLSNNGGTNWTDIGQGLPDVPHNVVLFDPNNVNNIYVGNDLGVYYANNVPTTGTPASVVLTWNAYSQGLEDAVMVSDIVVTYNNRLRVATYGRGFWERDFAPTITLPVVFKHFNVISTETGNLLKWVIATQANVANYEIEYSNDALAFKKIAVVKAEQGSSIVSYSYIHGIQNSMNGFYRIKIIDLDGSYAYSTIEEVKARKAVTKLSVYPNPTGGLFNIKLPAGFAGALDIKIYDNAGKLTMLSKVKLDLGQNRIQFDIGKLPDGNYHVVCENDKSRGSTSILKR